MRLLLSFFSCTLAFCTNFSAAAQNRIFQHLTPRDGLANITVLAITQDQRGFMWFGTSNGLSRYDTREFKTYKYDPENPASISSNYIRSAYCDSKGVLWIGTNEGLNRYDPFSDSFERFFYDPSDKNTLSNSSIRCFKEDRKGNLWVGTGNGLNCLKSTNGVVKIVRYLNEPTVSKKSRVITSIHEDAAGVIWASASGELTGIDPATTTPKYHVVQLGKTKNAISSGRISVVCGDMASNIWVGSLGEGFARFDPRQENFHFSHNRSGLRRDFFNVDQMVLSRSGKLWIGSNQGLFCFDPQKNELDNYLSDPHEANRLIDNVIMTIFEDRQQNLWVGTYSGGVSYIPRHSSPFVIMPIANKGGYSNQILADSGGDIWLKSDQNGLFRLNRESNRFIASPVGKMENENFSTAYFDRAGALWTGRPFSTLVKYKIAAGKLIESARYRLSSSNLPPPADDKISCILEDSNGQLWVATLENGLYIFNADDKKFLHYKMMGKSPLRLRDEQVTCLFEDSKKNLWIGTYSGVNLFNSSENKMEWFPTGVKGDRSSGSGAVNSIQEDNKGRIWIGTFYDGLKRYDPQKNILLPSREVESLSNNNISNIQCDGLGYLWLSNDLGLVRFHPDKKAIQQYYFFDGIPGADIIRNSGYKAKDGEMFFATNAGAFRFSPDQIPINNQLPAVAFTALKLFNKPVGIADNTGLLTREISETKEITFHYNQSIFTIDFAVLNFIRPEKNQYAYKLEGLEKDWNYVKNPSATYTNLPSGQYTLVAKGANNDGIWSRQSARLLITVLPPWWRTWYAWMFYFLLFFAATYLVVRFFWLRGVFQKEKELQQVKLNFFTNISHEIRTHLTLISGPVEQLLKSRKEDGEVQKQLNVAKNNSDRLLSLVNELMDFRKMEGGMTRYVISHHDIVVFLKNVLAAFEHLSRSKDIQTTFSSNKDSIMLWYDPDQLQKVIYNVLMNAYKFTSEGGNVSIVVEETDGRVKLEISDDGIGIAPEHLDKLFINYFQVYEFGTQNTGYGIGLALSKGIIENLKGSLDVRSKLASGGLNGQTTFTVMLLKGNGHFEAGQISQNNTIYEFSTVPAVSITGPAAEQIEDVRKYTILLVEDNEELRAFVRDALRGQYHVIEAGNGIEGWELAIEHIPDLVISDVMMAEMDGLELCRKIKSDIRTSHVPVILLTAKTAVPHQLEGLESGADLYVLKPFSIQILELNIRNLFHAREIMQQKYNRQVVLGERMVEVNNREEEFLNKIISFVEENMENKSLSVSELANYIGMSKSVLYKKLRAVTDMTINDFVKMIRLKKAALLLKAGHLTVNEVAYRVGYEDRKYFSGEFKKQFGKTPSEYALEN